MSNNEGLNVRIMESPQIRRVSTEDRTVEFVASDNSVDSYGTVLPVDKWDLSRFASNGVIGYMHDVYGGSVEKPDPDDVIGKGEAFVEGEQLIVRVTFEPADLNERADKIFRKIQFGSLKTVSVGFTPTKAGHWGDPDNGEQEDVYYYEGQQLLEVSIVNIPANPNAVKRSIDLEREAHESERKAEEPAVEVKAAEETVEVSTPDNSYLFTLARARQAMAKKH